MRRGRMEPLYKPKNTPLTVETQELFTHQMTAIARDQDPVQGHRYHSELMLSTHHVSCC